MATSQSAPLRRPWQFRIWDLLYWTTFAAVLLGLSRWDLEIGYAAPFVVLGGEFVAFVGLTAAFVDRARYRSRRHRAARGVLAGAFLAVLCLWPMVFLFAYLGMSPLAGLPTVIAVGASLGLVIGLIDWRWLFTSDTRYVTFAPQEKKSLVRLPRSFLIRLSDQELQFTDRAVRILRFAWRDTLLRRHREVTPEHILLALATLDRGMGQTTLLRFGLELATQAEDIETTLSAIPSQCDNVEPLLGRETGQLLDYAKAEAKSLGHHCIGTEHLILGLLQCGHCAAARYLRRQGIIAERFRLELVKLLGGK